jgi:hypothetical protein
MKFDPDELRPLILAMNGSVKAVAKKVRCDSEELRAFIMSTPSLRRAMDEVVARAVDQSVEVLFKGLGDHQSLSKQIAAAKVFVKSRAGQRRGFHHAGELELKVPQGRGALTLTWLPPGSPKEPPLIEGEVEDE